MSRPLGGGRTMRFQTQAVLRRPDHRSPLRLAGVLLAGAFYPATVQDAWGPLHLEGGLVALAPLDPVEATHPADRVARGDVKRLAELRQWMADMGITPKGQQDRRWVRPKPPPTVPASRSSGLRRLRVSADEDPSARPQTARDGLDARERANLRMYGTPNPSFRERFGRTDDERQGSS